MYGAVSRGPRGITALVCDTARITNGITVCITACVTRRDTEHSAIVLDAEAAWIQIRLNVAPSGDSGTGAQTGSIYQQSATDNQQ